MTTVLVVDDQELVRAGLCTVLDRHEDIDVVGDAADGRAAIEETRRLQPDVVLMDVRMPVLDGIAATREITAAGASPRVLMLTTFDLDDYVYDALRAGASGFLLKDTPPAALVELRARRRRAARPSDHPSAGRALRRAPGFASRLQRLTEREVEVLRWSPAASRTRRSRTSWR